eukprot:GILJ01017493.1.p1 GENE.GILJ01017493.1~~GILJ01017493.1.p1  ORF type:complete len:667 (+),score=76.29 GILJ01017493.1:38-2002(+)
MEGTGVYNETDEPSAAEVTETENNPPALPQLSLPRQQLEPRIPPPPSATNSGTPSNSGTPLFFSSGAGSTAGSPLRITIQQNVRALAGFIKEIPSLTNEADAQAKIDHLAAEPIKHLARIVYAERTATDFVRMRKAMICFCEHTLAECIDEQSKAHLKYFSSGGGSSVGPGMSPLVLGNTGPSFQGANNGGGAGEYEPSGRNNYDGDSFMASPRLEAINGTAATPRFAFPKQSPPPTPSNKQPARTRSNVSTISRSQSCSMLMANASTDYHRLLKLLLITEELPDQGTLIDILIDCKEALMEETTVVSVPAPCVVVGDIHGQITDLRRVIRMGGDFGKSTYLFLGDYVDRGSASIHCVAILALAKVLYPKKVFLLRGNHESKSINSIYGFLAEIERRYPKRGCSPRSPSGLEIYGIGAQTNPLFVQFNDMFRALPLAAVVDNSIFCVHGGLSRFAESLEAILCIDRFQDINEGALADLTWSDPAKINNYQHNWRGSGCQFGADVTLDFLRQNNLRFICRAHQCVKDGYQWSHNNRLVTVFSATNYCGLQNIAAVMHVAPRGAFDDPQNLSPRETAAEGDSASKANKPNGVKMAMSFSADIKTEEDSTVGSEVSPSPAPQEPFDGIRFELLPILSEDGNKAPEPNVRELPKHFST